MSKPITLSSILSSFFPGSEKVISEKLSAEEHASFAAEVSELNQRIDAQTQANTLVVADLAAANATITTLQANLTTANASLATVTAERDKFKAHHEKAASEGDKNPGEDENSRKPSAQAGYNQHAVDVWNKANRS